MTNSLMVQNIVTQWKCQKWHTIIFFFAPFPWENVEIKFVNKAWSVAPAAIMMSSLHHQRLRLHDDDDDDDEDYEDDGDNDDD